MSKDEDNNHVDQGIEVKETSELLVTCYTKTKEADPLHKINENSDYDDPNMKIISPQLIKRIGKEST